MGVSQGPSPGETKLGPKVKSNEERAVSEHARACPRRRHTPEEDGPDEEYACAPEENGPGEEYARAPQGDGPAGYSYTDHNILIFCITTQLVYTIK